MDYTSFRELFIRIFEKNGLFSYATEENIRKFHALTDMMIQTNRVMNITALTTEDKIIPLHYADCVKICNLLPEHAKVIDIGCGGGFPLLPLAIVRPDLQLTGLDSTEKKISLICVLRVSAPAPRSWLRKNYTVRLTMRPSAVPWPV